MAQTGNRWPADLKKTKQRAGVLEVLESADKPLSASDICSRLGKEGDTVWISTVYRVLETFVEKGVAIKSNVMNSDMALYELNRNTHKHYAVCLGCRKIINLLNCPVTGFIPELEDGEFQVTGHNLEIYGFCRNCKKRDKK